MVILTSFERSRDFGGEKFSVARWQPKGYAYKEIDFLSTVDELGQPLRLRDRDSVPGGALRSYKQAWLASVNPAHDRGRRLREWMSGLRSEEDIVLCCWCPYSQSTNAQIRQFGSFACHTGIIGQLIQVKRPDIFVMMDYDRQKYLVEEWRPV